tara:strand:- start:605 stop:1030 length:426 start_codon:yes stop_codon:yes gene_type:complete
LRRAIKLFGTKVSSSRILALCLGVAVVCIFVLILFVLSPISLGIVQCDGCSSESIALAGQLGRLDIVSLALVFVGLGVGFFALFGFGTIKEDVVNSAKKAAIEAVRMELKAEVERAHTNYMLALETSERTNAGSTGNLEDL